jgi:hypothetical protein
VLEEQRAEWALEVTGLPGIQGNVGEEYVTILCSFVYFHGKIRMSISLIFKSIEIRNLMSFGNAPQLIELADQGTVTVTGENLDQGGSNGAGKCLYPETRINIRVKGVIRQVSIRELYELARQMEAHKGADN